MNFQEYLKGIGYTSGENEDGSLSWVRDGDKINDTDSLIPHFNEFNRTDSLGRGIYGTQVFDPTTHGSTFEGPSGDLRYRLGVDAFPKEYEAAGGKESDFSYDPVYGYNIPMALQEKWAQMFQKPDSMDGFFSNMPLTLGGLMMGGIANGAFGAGPMGSETLGSFSQSFPMDSSSFAFDAGGKGMFDDIINWSGDFSSGGIDFANSPSQLQNPLASANPMEGLTTGINQLGNVNPFGGPNLPQNLTSGIFGGSYAPYAGTGTGATSLMDQFKSFLSTPQIPGLPNSTGANGASALINYFLKQQQADALKSAGQQAANQNNALLQPQRFPFQQAYLDLMTNPNSYHQTPYAQGQQNLANQAFQANVAKYGPSGTGFDQYLKNFQNIQSNDFFKLADQLSGAGGFNQGPGGGGQFTFAGGQGAANAGFNAFEGFGKILSDAQPQKGYVPEQNPASGVTKIFS